METVRTHLGALAVACPPCTMDQDQIATSIRNNYGHRLNSRSLSVLKKVFSHPSVLRRRFAVDRPEELVDEDPDARIARFTRWAIELSDQSARKAIAQAGLGVEDITGLVVNTCTGYICPGLSTYLVERLGLKATIPAHDMVGGGCGGAVPNLQISSGLLNQSRQGAILSIAVEICTGTFQMGDDLSLIISNALFADGASAIVLWNRPQGLAMIDFASRHAPEYREHIRYVYKRGQLHNQLSLQLPGITGKVVAQVLNDLLGRHRLEPHQIRHWAIHPGGNNVINAVKDEVGLTERQLRTTRDVLAMYGNMSSPTVGFVLNEILKDGVEPGDWCGMVAFGAGMSAHALLLQAHDSPANA